MIDGDEVITKHPETYHFVNGYAPSFHRFKPISGSFDGEIVVPPHQRNRLSY